MKLNGYIILGPNFTEITTSYTNALDIVESAASSFDNSTEDYTITKAIFDVTPHAEKTELQVQQQPTEVGDNVISMWTDGACKGNPGTGGWGALVYVSGSDEPVELYGGERDTTNNRMELKAVIEGLKSLGDNPTLFKTIYIYTDSQYVKNGMTSWVSGWIKNGWRTAKKEPVKNADLWRELNSLCEQFKPTWRWVRGHNGDPNNERADQLANKGVYSQYN